jgi:alpha-tubulin suppressor-like RCC1 family protein
MVPACSSSPGADCEDPRDATLEGDATTPADASLQRDATCPGDADSVADGRVVDAGPPPMGWTKVSLGMHHTCGLRSDRTLWCWGSHTSGQLGHGVDIEEAQEPELAPVQVRQAGGTGDSHWDDWIDVSAGLRHTCGLRANGTLWCWGDGSSGRLGKGGAGSEPAPVRVVAAEELPEEPWSDWTAVWAGDLHTCGRRQDGSLWCWGWRSQGQLGNGISGDPTLEGRSTPALVLAAGEEVGGDGWDDWHHAAGGELHTCGRREDGSLWCWGLSGFGRLGDGVADGFVHATPVQVVAAEETNGPAWDDWLEVTAAQDSTCARRLNRTVWCWGRRLWGLLGDGLDGSGDEDSHRDTPIQVLQADASAGGDGWSDWTRVQAGTSHVCGVRAEGSLWCWGLGEHGRLGVGDSPAQRVTPGQVLQSGEAPDGEAWHDWTDVALGYQHTCGLRQDGSLWCWGDGGHGQLGDGETTAPRPTPTRVMEPSSDL